MTKPANPRPRAPISDWARCVACSVLVLTVTAASSSDPAAELRTRALQAKSVADAQNILGVRSPEPGRRVLLEVPDIVGLASASPQPVAVKVVSQIPGTDWIGVFIDRGARPLVDFKEFPPGSEVSWTVRAEVSRTTSVRAVVRAAGKYYQVSREVKVAQPASGPCPGG